jgi:hypothetical protein
LKEIILIMEKIKENLFVKSDRFKKGFLEYYQNFNNRVNEFLKIAINMVMGSESMQNYQDMRKSLNENDPLSKEIGIFRKKREQAAQIEQLFRKIKDNYKATKINSMKIALDGILSKEHVCYNVSNGQTFFQKSKAEFASRVMNSPDLSGENLVSKFSSVLKGFEKLELGKMPVGSRRVSQGGQRVDKSPTIVEKSPGKGILRPSGSSQKLNRDGNRVTFQNPDAMDGLQKSTQRPKNPPNSVRQPQAHVMPKSSNKMEIGAASNAQISPNNCEVILKYNPKRPNIQKKGEFVLGNGHGEITSLRALDSRNIAIGSQSGILYLADMDTNPQNPQNFIKKKFKLDSPINTIMDINARNARQSIPPPTKLILGLGSPENCIAILDFSSSSTTVSRMKGHKGPVRDLVHYGTGKLFSCGDDGIVGLWDVPSGKALSLAQAHNGPVNSLCLMNSEKILLTAGDDCKVQVFDVGNTGKISKKAELKDYYPIKKVASFHNNTNFAVACSSDGMIKVWNINKKE